MLLVETFPVGAFQCNCSVLACGDTKQALVVDPGGDPERVLAVVKHYDLEVRAIVHTHAHLDHIAATRDIKEATGAEIRLHPGDRWLYDNFAMQAMMFGWPLEGGAPASFARRGGGLPPSVRPLRDVLPVEAELAHEA